MKPITTAVLITIAFPLISLAQSSAVKKNPTEHFQRYWTEFRNAALANDKNKVVSLTAFPFRTRGMADDSPVKTYEKAAFLELLDKLLGLDSGQSESPESMRQFLVRTPKIDPKMLDASGEAAEAGTFSFKRIKGKWRFASAYTEEDFPGPK